MKMTVAARKALPKSDKFPATNPKSYVTLGKLSPAMASTIRAKANKVMGK